MLWLLMVGCGTPLDSATADTASENDTGEIDAPVDDFLYGDEILEFEITLDAAALASLAVEPKTDVVATFGFQGESYEVALRLKGSESGSFRTLDEKAGFKIDFREWDSEQTFHGVRRLTLNNMIQDPTMAHEAAAYWFFDRMGVVAPRHGHANVWVNGERFGLYGVVESMDEQFIDRHWPDDDEGNLYEGGYGGDFYSTAEPKWQLKEGDEATYMQDLDPLIAAFEATPDGGMLDFIRTYFNESELLGMWAVELAIADSDGYTTYGNNFQLYHAPNADRWTMIPWGPDQAFQRDSSIHIEGQGLMFRACQLDAACGAALDARVADVMTEWETGELATFVADETARIEADCRSDPRSEWGDYGCRDEQAAMRAWVEARPALVRAELD